MSLTNATLLRIDTPGRPGINGVETYAQGPSIAVRIAVDASLYQARRELGATLKDATQAFYVRRAVVPAGAVIAEKTRLLVRVDGDAQAAIWHLVYVKPRTKAGGLSHVEAYGHEVPPSPPAPGGTS